MSACSRVPVSMIKSELVQRIAEHNPHLYQRDVENIVNAILDEIVAALGAGRPGRAAWIRRILGQASPRPRRPQSAHRRTCAGRSKERSVFQDRQGNARTAEPRRAVPPKPALRGFSVARMGVTVSGSRNCGSHNRSCICVKCARRYSARDGHAKIPLGPGVGSAGPDLHRVCGRQSPSGDGVASIRSIPAILGSMCHQLPLFVSSSRWRSWVWWRAARRPGSGSGTGGARRASTKPMRGRRGRNWRICVAAAAASRYDLQRLPGPSQGGGYGAGGRDKQGATL